MQTYEGSCHCGTVQFSVTATVTELITCDCSLCRRRNALMITVPEQALTIRQGEDAITLYQWNTGRARHYFCKRCGIYVFHRKRSMPDHFGVNVFCLEGLDPASFPVRGVQGASMTVEDPAARAAWPGPREN
jgi:hypothetical protein